MDTIPPNFFNTKILAVDLETTCKYRKDSPDPHRDDVLLISMYNGRDAIVLPPGPWVPHLFTAIEQPEVTTFIHNACFDLAFLKSIGFKGRPVNLWDTMIVEQLLNAGLLERVDLASTAWRRCAVQMSKEIRSTFMHHTGGFTPKQLEHAKCN